MQKRKFAEKMPNNYYNTGFMHRAIHYVIGRGASPFRFLLELGEFWEKSGALFNRYQLLDVFERFHEFIEQKYPEISSETFSLLKLDYLLYHRLKPKIWWTRVPNKNVIIREFSETNQSYQLDELYKHAVVTTYQDHHLIVIYKDNLPVVFHHS
jgi:hypothetical protein